ncbi:MAG: NAD(P)H-binding protein [Thermomicrobiales bacterium]
MSGTILLAGASGDVGQRIARELLSRGATVRALSRPGTNLDNVARLIAMGLHGVEADYTDAAELQKAMLGVDCVVTTLSGPEPVIIHAQMLLLEAAVAAGVPRFMPSDYSIDYTGPVEPKPAASPRIQQAPRCCTNQGYVGSFR